jgi:hypothetical protein
MAIREYTSLFPSSNFIPTQEMIDFFNVRTKRHIFLVRKYIEKIGELNLFNNYRLEDLARNHDLSKFREPEYTPYVFVTWDYKLKDEGKQVILSDEMKKFQNKATNHHIKTNPHHPEYWDKNFDSVPLNDRDSKTVGYITNAVSMSEIYIAEMIADWCSMSEEKGINTPLDWANKTIGTRWGFSIGQETLIYDLMEKIWK